MEVINRKKLIRFLAVAAPVIIADQITKLLAVRHIEFARNLEVIPGFFYITHLYNTGGAFGIFANSAPWVRAVFFLGVSVLAAVFVLYLYKQTPYENRLFGWGLCLVFGGAAGNLIDRFRIGKVIDFLEFYVSMIPWNLFNPWPPFNIADSAISIGVAILAIHFALGKDPL